MTFASWSDRWVPPAPALKAALVAVGVLAAIVAAGAAMGGADAAVGAFLGAVSILALAAKRPPWWEIVVFALVLGLCVAGGAAASTPVAIALWVFASVVATAPFAVRHGAVTSIVPVMIALVSSGASDIGPARAALGTVIAALAFAGVIVSLGVRQGRDVALSRSTLVLNLVALGVSTAVATGVVVSMGLTHGVWVVVAIATVLVPMPRETVREARTRVGGTVVGALAGTAVATVLPPWAAVAVGLVAVLFGLGSTLAQRRRQFVAYIAVATVAVTSVAAHEQAVDVALQRVGYTLAGAIIAVALGLGVAFADRSRSRAEQAD